MINIGIEKHQGLVYEIDANRGRPVWPTPVITSAVFVYPSDGTMKAESSTNVFGYRFREDSYDPIARIRRGRFYSAENSSQPQSCIVSPHPAVPMESIARDIHATVNRWKFSMATLSGINILKESASCPLCFSARMSVSRHGRLLA